MEIVYFHRRGGKGKVSIEENFKPIINAISTSNSVKTFRVPYSGSNPYNLIRNIIFIWKHSTRIGVNHITGDIHYGILGLIGKKSVLTIHDDYAMRKVHHGVIDKFYKWLFWIYFPIKYADAPICTTPATLDNIRKYYNSSKLQVITHHVVPDSLVPIYKPFCKECPRFLQVGTDVNKNLETTLRTIAKIRCKLVVLKPMSEEQKALAMRLKIDYENKYDLPYEEVIKEYQRCDIVLFPSLYEGLGVPIFEGQAAGKPVITTNKDPMKWVAGDGAVLLNDPLDTNEYLEKLLKLINDDDFRNNIIVKGVQNAKRFSLNEAVQKYDFLYKTLI